MAVGITSAPSWLVTSILIGAWYASNIGVLLLNKYLLTSTGFDNPVFLTACHMSACVVIGLMVSATGMMTVASIKSRKQLTKVVVLAAIFCGTIVLGNASLKYIPVSFNQAIGATTPFFTAILAYMMQGSRESRWTYLSLVPIALGVVVASGGEPAFSVLGFSCCLAATALRALKSVVQSIIMSDPAEKLDPMSLLLYMSAVSLLFLVPMAALLEPGCTQQALALIGKDHGFAWWLLSNSSLAYAVNLTNFLVTKYTSALTLQVLGNAKGVVAAFISVLVFANTVTLTGCLGYGITVGGVFMYSESKRQSKAAATSKHAALPVTDKEKEEEPLLGSSDDGESSNTRGATGSLQHHFRGGEQRV